MGPWYELDVEGRGLKGKPIVVEDHIIQILIKSRVQEAGCLAVWLSGIGVVIVIDVGCSSHVVHGIEIELE